MQVRPVDIQVMLHRAPEMNRATNNDGSRAQTQQNQFAQEFERLREKERTSVVQPQEPDEGQSVNPDGSAGKEKEQRGKKRRPSDKVQSEQKTNPPEIGGGMLDIRI